MMYKIGIVLFDDFTDVDFFLMYDLLGRTPTSWQVSVLGTAAVHRSHLGIEVKTDGPLTKAQEQDAVLIVSGKKGVPEAIANPDFMAALNVNPDTQLIGSICAGAFILHELGLMEGKVLTTHPDAKSALQQRGAEVLDRPLVVQGNIATAGGCLSSLYLLGWLAERLYDEDMRRAMLRQLIPAGQEDMFESLITSTIAVASRD